MDFINELKNFMFHYEAKQDKTFVSTPFKSPVIAEGFINFNAGKGVKVLNAHLSNLKDEAYILKRDVISNLIKSDPAAPKKLDRENMSEMILSAAQETGIDPLVITSIAKRESHFNQNVPTKFGSGIMQLTTISIKDMFLRPQVYDPALKPLMKKYGTFDKILKAKEKDPSIDLGKFGDMLTHYGTTDKLVQAMRKDAELNIKLGAYLYKAKLAQAKGDERKALALYNGSNLKESYAKDVYKNITQLRKQNNSFENYA